MDDLRLWAVEIRSREEARAALRQLLGDASIEVRDDGKPVAPGGPHFNLSHTDGLAVVAVSREREVGVDVERVRPVERAVAIARRLFSQDEAELVAQAGEETRDLVFLCLWVAHEARLKLGAEPALVRELDVPPGYVAAVALA